MANIKRNSTILKRALFKLSGQDGVSVRAGVESLSTKDLAKTYLTALGCAVSSENANYSLLDTQTDTENIENENIDETDKFTKLKSGTTSTTDKFANTDDPFYELDDELPESKKLMLSAMAKTSEPNLVKVAVALFKIENK